MLIKKLEGVNKILRPYYTMRCFTRIFFPLAFSLVFLIPICYYRKRKGKCEKITQRENFFLYYTTRGMNTRAGCVSFSHCGTFEACNSYQNANPTHSVIWALDS